MEEISTFLQILYIKKWNLINKYNNLTILNCERFKILEEKNKLRNNFVSYMRMKARFALMKIKSKSQYICTTKISLKKGMIKPQQYLNYLLRIKKKKYYQIIILFLITM